MSDNEPRQLREIRETATEHPRWAHIHGWDELLSYIDAEAKRAADLTRELELLDARLHLRLAEERARADEAEAKLAGVITLVESQLSGYEYQIFRAALAKPSTPTTPDNIDDRVGAWHAGGGEDVALHVYLGWTWEQYKDWGERGKFPDVPPHTPDSKET